MGYYEFFVNIFFPIRKKTTFDTFYVITLGKNVEFMKHFQRTLETFPQIQQKTFHRTDENPLGTVLGGGGSKGFDCVA